jgi:DNA modification methylase
VATHRDYIFPEPYQGPPCIWKIKTGDALGVLREFNANHHVRCWITSPPYYGQVDYEVSGQIGWEPTVDEYVNRLTEIAYEMRQHSTPDANFFLVIRDGFANSGGPGGDNKRADGSLKKKPRKGLRNPGIPAQALFKVPHRIALAFERIGWWLKQDIIWNKKDALSAAPRRLSYSYEHILHFVLDPKISYFNREAIYRPASIETLPELKKPYCGSDRHDYEKAKRVRPGDTKRNAIKALKERDGKCYLLDILEIRPKPSPTIPGMPDYYHKAPFPLVLAEMCVLFGSEQGDWIGDPFCGSGTTLVAALKHGRNAFGIELNPTDVKAAAARIKEAINNEPKA